MESLFVWIVMSAGAAIALLGAVLFTSERELKTRRREVEELVTKLENMQQGNAPAPADNSAALAELRAADQVAAESNYAVSPATWNRAVEPSKSWS